MLELRVFVEFTEGLGEFVADDGMVYGPVEEGFVALLPVRTAWVIVKNGWGRPAEKRGIIFVGGEDRKEGID